MESWNHCQHEHNITPARVIANNLSRIKDRTIKWTREKRIRDEEELRRVDRDIALPTASDSLGFTSSAKKDQLTQLEMEKIKLLIQKEETWRLKSRAIWLEAADNNTKFFR